MYETPSRLSQIALGLALGAIFSSPIWLPGCASLAPLVECKLDALKVLPEDPQQATVADARDVIGRLKACHIVADAGR